MFLDCFLNLSNYLVFYFSWFLIQHLFKLNLHFIRYQVISKLLVYQIWVFHLSIVILNWFFKICMFFLNFTNFHLNFKQVICHFLCKFLHQLIFHVLLYLFLLCLILYNNLLSFCFIISYFDWLRLLSFLVEIDIWMSTNMMFFKIAKSNKYFWTIRASIIVRLLLFR